MPRRSVGSCWDFVRARSSNRTGAPSRPPWKGSDAIRVLIISQWFPPEPVDKGAELARALIDRGHEAIVVTGYPNYPGGYLYSGYEMRPLLRETVNGIPTIRVPLFPSHDRSGWKRFINYSSFAISAAAIAPWVVKRPDVAYVYHPPGTVGLPALVFQAVRGVPFVLDIQDLWPDTLAATRMVSGTRALAIVGAWMRLLYRKAAAVVVLSPGFRAALEERGVPSDKLAVIHNWSLGGAEVDASEQMQSHPALSGPFNVVFAGNIGEAQGLSSVVEAAGLLAASHPDIRIVIAGDGVAAADVERRIEEQRLGNVVLLPRLDSQAVGGFLRQADALLVHLRRDPLFEMTIPSKTQAYMSAGRPLVMAVEGDAAAMVIRAGAGLTCQPEEPRSIADAIAALRDMSESERNEMGAQGRAFYEEHLSIDCGVDQLSAILESVQSYRRDGPRRLSRRSATI